MGQNEVYQFLKKNKGKWFTSKQIQEAMKTSSSSTSTNLMRLRKHKAIYFKQSPKKANSYLYMVK